MKQFILVTGASSGIGESACRVLITHGYEVISGVRSQADADRLSQQLGASVHPVFMDVIDADVMNKARTRAAEIIGDGELVAIINNAGIAISGTVLHVPLSEWRKQFEVNVMGVILTTQLFFPLLIKYVSQGDPHPRRIINISSVSGLFASPFLGPYSASKFALEALSDSLRRELYMYDVQVVLIEPGNILTPMWEKAKSSVPHLGPEYQAIRDLKDRFIEQNVAHSISVQAVDAIILKTVRDRKVRPRYLVRKGKWGFRLIQMLPASWVDRMVRKKLQQKSGIRPF
jgi:NAD(P)-dependent dehydrogenase (short-subunit alcohol dehydrogenase family)